MLSMVSPAGGVGGGLSPRLYMMSEATVNACAADSGEAARLLTVGTFTGPSCFRTALMSPSSMLNSGACPFLFSMMLGADELKLAASGGINTYALVVALTNS